MDRPIVGETPTSRVARTWNLPQKERPPAVVAQTAPQTAPQAQAQRLPAARGSAAPAEQTWHPRWPGRTPPAAAGQVHIRCQAPAFLPQNVALYNAKGGQGHGEWTILLQK